MTSVPINDFYFQMFFDEDYRWIGKESFTEKKIQSYLSRTGSTAITIKMDRKDILSTERTIYMRLGPNKLEPKKLFIITLYRLDRRDGSSFEKKRGPTDLKVYEADLTGNARYIESIRDSALSIKMTGVSTDGKKSSFEGENSGFLAHFFHHMSKGESSENVFKFKVTDLNDESIGRLKKSLGKTLYNIFLDTILPPTQKELKKTDPNIVEFTSVSKKPPINQ